MLHLKVDNTERVENEACQKMHNGSRETEKKTKRQLQEKTDNKIQHNKPKQQKPTLILSPLTTLGRGTAIKKLKKKTLK